MSGTLRRRLAAVTVAAALAGAAPGPAVHAQGTTHVLIVVGLGGTAEYRATFHAQAVALRAALTERHGLAAEAITYLGERPDETPGETDDRSTRANVLRELGEIAQRAGRDDRVMVVLIGHGTAERDESRFNLPGPDLSPSDFEMGLMAFPTQSLALVHTGSASGGFVEPLSGPNRVIVAATRTARERNFTEFGRFFVDAVSGEGADLDHDERLSLLEAYLYARAEVERHYQEENELLTEHAILDDNGDGEGSHDPGLSGPDGQLAATFHLGGVSGTSAQAPDDPVLARLYGERSEIQSRIDLLRAARDAMTQERYDAELEELLIELALKNREIRQREGGGA